VFNRHAFFKDLRLELLSAKLLLLRECWSFLFLSFFLLLFVEGYEALAERERRLQVCNVRSLETGRGFRARGFDHVSEKQFTFWVDEISE